MSRRAPFQDSSNKGLGRKTRPCHPGGFTGKKIGWGVVLKMRFGNMTIKVFPDLSLLKKGVVGLFPPSLRRKLPVCEGAVTFSKPSFWVSILVFGRFLLKTEQVGGFNPSKNITVVKIGSSSPIFGVKIKNL